MKMILFIFAISFNFNVLAKDIDYSYKGKNYEGYYLKSEGAQKTIFIIHDWDGIDAYEKKRAEMFHKLGLNVFAIDIYGKGVRPSSIEKKKETSGFYYKNRPLMLQAVEAGILEAKRLGMETGENFLVGYCFGGTVGLEVARNKDAFSKYFIFHGGLQTPEKENYANNKAKLFIYHGGADQAVTLIDVSNLAGELEKYKQDYIIQIYSGAPHAFTHFGGDRYREKADKESWMHMVKNI